MAVSRDLLEILVCPETKQPVSLASAELLARLRRDAEAGSLRNRGGQPVTQPIARNTSRPRKPIVSRLVCLGGPPSSTGT